MTVDVHALTGAYVLDAVAGPEQRRFERHLADCGSCAREVLELRETAARLALAAAVAPPAHLRPAVLARIGAVHQGRAGSRRRPVPARLATALAAALLVVCGSLGVLAARQHQALAESRQQAAAMTALLRADDARLVHRDLAGGHLTMITSRHRDRVVLLADHLPPAPPGHVYQAWTIDAVFHPAGLLDRPGDGVAVTRLGTATEVGITVEPAGGSTHPTTPPIVTMAVT
jgi:anti-sigma factor RsiW